MAKKFRLIRKPKDVVDICRDGVTGLLRRDALEERINSSFNERILEITKGKKDYSVILFDVDFFKSINDLFSHEQGDLVLKEIGDILTEYSSQKDFIGVLGRWGGEEFLIALPYSNIGRAKYIADEIRDEVANYDFENIKSTEKTLRQRITISLGVGCVDLSKVIKNKKNQNKHLKETIRNADTALDYAKYMGRNNVQTFSEFLVNEVKNLDLVRQFYFQNSSKTPKELRNILDTSFLNKYPKIHRKMKKHFYFIRTEIDPRDTRTQAVFADRLYKLTENLEEEKKEFLENLEKYISA